MERVSKHVNPGTAWETRPEVWTEFLHETPIGPKFGYSYSERFSNHDGLERIIARIKEDPDSRQLYLSVWDPNDVEHLGAIARVPCSLGYLFQVRNDRLNMTYSMRSCDAVTHFHNDVYLAFRLQQYVSDLTGYPVGNFTHFINSLHIYRKDSKGIF
jgi:thymidylate synthase